VAGVSVELGKRWRCYAEAGYDSGVDQPQEPLRLQLGFEHEGKRRLMEGRLGWYAAMDINLYQELDWQPNTTVQIGVAYPTGRGTSRYRVALEIASGRSVLGELSTYDETFVALGWYFDF
jgi:hypothetical protein